MPDYLLEISNYAGPLDVLVELVKAHRMDIFAINLVELTNAYVSWIATMKNEALDLAAEYMTMAVSLIQMKARLLLVDPAEEEEAPADESALLTQLTTYYQFKRVAGELRTREKARYQLFLKHPDDYEPYQLPIDETRLDGHSDVVSLMLIMRKMFERVSAAHVRTSVITSLNLSPAARRRELIALFKAHPQPTWQEIFAGPTLEHFVITFITLLDMARKGEVILSQAHQFAPLTIKVGHIKTDEYEF